MMKFKRILKRKVYPTWTSITRVKGYKAYIYYIPDCCYYHFQIDHDNNIVYMSLTEDIKFNNYDDCCLAVDKWIKSNKI